jgi:hypothetical protein
MLLELGHTNERYHGPIFGSCSNKPIKNTTQNRVVPYWIYIHGSRHTTVPEELYCLTFVEKQRIAVASSHMSLIHLKNGTLVSKGHHVAVEQNISKLFLVLPRHPDDVDMLRIIRSGRFSDQEFYEKVFKIRRMKVLAALYWLLEHNAIYQ